MRAANDPRVQLLVELADETRYAVLERLEQGPASASELAERLGVSPTQLANHLRRLRDAGLVAVSHQGRLALYELAEPGLREIFSMLNGLRGAPPRTGRPVRVAATCYDHLAGQIGVALMDHLVQSRALEARDGEGELKLGPAAAGAFAELGVELPTKPPAARSPSPAWTVASDDHTSAVNSAPSSRPPCAKKAGSSPPRSHAASNSRQPATKPYTASASASKWPPITPTSTPTDMSERGA